MEQLHVRLSFMELLDASRRSVASCVTHQMATQISSVKVQKDDRVQLLKQTSSRHSGLDASHHLHRLELRWLKDWTSRGSPAGETHTETTPQHWRSRLRCLIINTTAEEEIKRDKALASCSRA